MPTQYAIRPVRSSSQHVSDLNRETQIGAAEFKRRLIKLQRTFTGNSPRKALQPLILACDVALSALEKLDYVRPGGSAL